MIWIRRTTRAKTRRMWMKPPVELPKRKGSSALRQFLDLLNPKSGITN
jgi:hypothetical protein